MSQKSGPQTDSDNCQNLNNFQNSFTSGKRSKNPYNMFHPTQNVLMHYLWNVEGWVCSTLQTWCLKKGNISCHTVQQTVLLSTLQHLLEMSAFSHIRALRCLLLSSIASSVTLWFMPWQTSGKHFFSLSMLCSCDWCTHCWYHPISCNRPD